MGQRVDNWPTKLSQLIESNRNRRFRWGRFDCFIWAAMCVDAVRGEKLVGQLKTDLGDTSKASALEVLDKFGYTSKASALEVLEKFGSTEEAISSYLGKPQNINMTSRGDVVTIDYEQEGYNAAGVFDGQQVIVPGPKGLVVVPSVHILKSWKV